MGWHIAWYTITDSFDADFGIAEWHGHDACYARPEPSSVTML